MDELDKDLLKLELIVGDFSPFINSIWPEDDCGQGEASVNNYFLDLTSKKHLVVKVIPRHLLPLLSPDCGVRAQSI